MGYLDLNDAGIVLPSTQLAEGPAAVAKANMRQFLVDTMYDQLTHAQVVAAGRFLFRQVIMESLGPLYGNTRGQCDVLADVMYRFLEVQWKDRYPYEARWFLDKVHVASPESQAEFDRAVDDAWQLEIGGSEEGLRAHYEGSARVRTGAYLGGRTSRR